MWIIDVNHLDKKQVPIKSAGFKEGVPLPCRFRLLDDDREVYFEGATHDCDTGNYDAFAPLDEYGTPDSGCTIIQYQRADGKWEDL